MANPRPRPGVSLFPLALGGLGGLLYAASIPKAEMALLAWICLVPPLTCLLARTSRAGSPSTRPTLAMGLTFGLVGGLGRIYWIAETLQNYGGLGPVMAAITNGLLILYLALYPACFLALAGRLAQEEGPVRATRPPLGLIAFPWLAGSAWVVLEWLLSWLFTGFPWQLLGYSQYRNLALIQIASITGVYGVSFALVAVNAAAAVAVAQVLRRRPSLGLLWTLGPVVALVASLHLYGSARLDHLNRARGETVRFGVVQGNIPQDQKWKDHRKTAATTRHYLDLTRQLMAAHPDLDVILLPETALPYFFNDPAYATYAGQVRDLARQVQRPILVGSLEGSTRDWPGEIYNRAFMLDAQGAVQGYADKVHLVPFGEYLPLPWLSQYLEGLTAESGRFTGGDRHRTVPLPGTEWRLGVFICYESIFPEIPRALARLGAHVLVNITNDAWFGTTAAPYQHFAMTALRAVETGRAVVRAANTGISGAIAPSGAILEATPIFAPVVLAVEVPVRSEVTPYVAHGDLFVWLCVGMLIAGTGCRLWRRSQSVAAEVAAANTELAAWSQTPHPLTRPLVLLHGYASGPGTWQPFLEHLRACTTNANEVLFAPDLNADAGIATLAGRVCGRLPAGRPVDLVGHSMGGLVACEVARHRACGDRVFSLATPLRGAGLIRWGRLLRRPYPTLLADLVPGSAFLSDLAAAMPGIAPALHTWRMVGDPAVCAWSADGGGAHREYRPMPWAGPAGRHRLAHTDPRVLRDLIGHLRA